ncbi:DNA (cytosine-5-)-methyltransferase [Pseudobacter ginsenosidimutans]|uniref:Cytosine-specific methyltransferase n=1 Tax=Pseudobacter ginsenosidimutans TaxID=661488 RepID=A0A4Q7MSF4_9BACT|nr:DNA (cytosine-5-)-methyltransferase [Pseudobacter ginsenosidimutans]QEC41503.1 DNA (cytosine-5-)-methyltransferase [Pseudobacter ginsenosidimutans]RZS71715.1 DNA (cytosine-5)-methyltransferase 1 [Pseudobacter ginsenosidimutans]
MQSIEQENKTLESSLQPLIEKLWKGHLFGAENHRSAIISHYLHSNKIVYKKNAIQYGKEMINGHFAEKMNDKIAEEALQYIIRYNDQIIPFQNPSKPEFTFIDLFAGVGGFRLALQSLQGECIFSSEWDKMAQRTYYANFGEIPFGDITKEETRKWVPEKFDLLCGGFPCQPFSIAGVSKKNSLGRKHGFEDEKQGNLFFHVAKIIEEKRPKAFFLENVKNLVSHDKGNTFKVIKETLEELGYTFYSKVLNGKHFVPQHRERTFMVGFDKKVFKGEEQFSFPELPLPERRIKEILENRADPKYTLSDKLWDYLQGYARKHKEKGNGFGFGLVDLNGISRTMSARYYKDGAEILIPQKDKNPRRLTVREAARLQGYPDNFVIDKVSMNQAYKQFGNSVVVPLIRAIGEQIVEVLKKTPVKKSRK